MGYCELQRLWGTLAVSWAIVYAFYRAGIMTPKWPWVMPMFFFGAIIFALLWNVCRVGKKSKRRTAEETLEQMDRWVEFLCLPGLDKELDPYLFGAHDEEVRFAIRSRLADYDALKAELAAARPLLEAVRNCPLGALEGAGTHGHGTYTGDILKEVRLLKETNVAYRAAKEGK